MGKHYLNNCIVQRNVASVKKSVLEVTVESFKYFISFNTRRTSHYIETVETAKKGVEKVKDLLIVPEPQ